MRFQKSQPAGAATLVPPSASTGPLKNMVASSPARKAHTHEIHEKVGNISNTCELPWPVRGDMKKRLTTKPAYFGISAAAGWGCCARMMFMGGSSGIPRRGSGGILPF
jgi:hypothetical protein